MRAPLQGNDVKDTDYGYVIFRELYCPDAV